MLTRARHFLDNCTPAFALILGHGRHWRAQEDLLCATDAVEEYSKIGCHRRGQLQKSSGRGRVGGGVGCLGGSVSEQG